MIHQDMAEYYETFAIIEYDTTYFGRKCFWFWKFSGLNFCGEFYMVNKCFGREMWNFAFENYIRWTCVRT